MPQKRRQYPPELWSSIKALIAKGATLRECEKSFDVPYSTLISRSARERWNVKALQTDLQLPRRTKAQRLALDKAVNDLPDNLPAIVSEIRENFSCVLLNVSRFYRNAELELTRKESRQVLQFIYAASKLLSPNGGQSALATPQLNVALLSLRPGELQIASPENSRQALTTGVATVCESVDTGSTLEGNPNQTPSTPDNSDAQSSATNRSSIDRPAE